MPRDIPADMETVSYQARVPDPDCLRFLGTLRLVGAESPRGDSLGGGWLPEGV